jgi:NAD-dependent dihydropyrimidine dehydrogenase PreA subunit
MSKVEIYYFSGTGNSLHVAQEIQKRIPDTALIPILSLLNEEAIELKGDVIGLVFPIYLSSTPIPVRKFINKIHFKPGQYLFAVTTNCGYPGNVDIYLERLLAKKSKDLAFYYTLKMISNSPKGLQPSFMISQNWANTITEQHILDLEKNVQKELDIISKAIINKERNTGKDAPSNKKGLKRTMSKYLELPLQWYVERTDAKIGFYTDATCTGCGVCESVCPSQKIKIVNGKPLWQDEVRCYYCYACFNYCPQQSILVKNYIHKDGRYHYPGITAKDIAKQKTQE